MLGLSKRLKQLLGQTEDMKQEAPWMENANFQNTRDTSRDAGRTLTPDEVPSSTRPVGEMLGRKPGSLDNYTAFNEGDTGSVSSALDASVTKPGQRGTPDQTKTRERLGNTYRPGTNQPKAD